MPANERFKFNIGDLVKIDTFTNDYHTVVGRRYHRVIEKTADHEWDNADIQYRVDGLSTWFDDHKLTEAKYTAKVYLDEELGTRGSARHRARVVGYSDDGQTSNRWFVEETDELPENYEIVISPETKTKSSKD